MDKGGRQQLTAISELTLPTHQMGCLACPTRVVGNSRVPLGSCKTYSPRAVAAQGCSMVRLTFHQLSRAPILAFSKDQCANDVLNTYNPFPVECLLSMSSQPVSRCRHRVLRQDACLKNRWHRSIPRRKEYGGRRGAARCRGSSDAQSREPCTLQQNQPAVSASLRQSFRGIEAWFPGKSFINWCGPRQ